MSRNWNPLTHFKKENTPDSLINENTASPFQCYHCTSGKHTKYFTTQSTYIDHMINNHPSEWPVRIQAASQKPKWINQDLLGEKPSIKQQKDIRAAYLNIRAASDVGIAVYVTDKEATSNNRTNTHESLSFTHVRALNHAMFISGRNEGCVRAVLNGKYGLPGRALVSRNEHDYSIDSQWSIYELTSKAITDLKEIRTKKGLVGNGNTLQLNEKYPEDKFPNKKVYQPVQSNVTEPTTVQLNAQFLNGSYYAKLAQKTNPNADITYQYMCKICNDFFSAALRREHWKLDCALGTTAEQVNVTTLTTSETEPSDNPFEVTIPTAVVDIPVKDNSSFWDLIDNTPEMNWTAFSEKLGTDVFKKYLTLEDENRQLTTANQELSQRLEQSYVLINTLEADLAGLEAYTRPKEDSNEESLPSNKAEVLQGIQNAGRASAQEIYREHKKT